MDISANIKSIREAKRIKQVEIATFLKVEPSNYAKLEKRGNKLTVEQLEKIAGALGVGLLELLTGEPPAVADGGRLKELEARVLELIEAKSMMGRVIENLEFDIADIYKLITKEWQDKIVNYALEHGILDRYGQHEHIRVTNESSGFFWHWNTDLGSFSLPSIGLFMTASQINQALTALRFRNSYIFNSALYGFKKYKHLKCFDEAIMEAI